MVTRVDINQAISKAIAYNNVNKPEEARDWALTVIVDMIHFGLLTKQDLKRLEN